MSNDFIFTPYVTAHSNERALYLNAKPISDDAPRVMDCLAFFKPHANALKNHALITGIEATYNAVFIAIPKSVEEARGLIARGLSVLKPGGFLSCAAGNKAGGGRIAKLLQGFGLEGLQSISKNKSRCAYGHVHTYDHAAVAEALSAAALQPTLDGDFYSMPGIFGWNKIDKGSEILVQHFPNLLSGIGADFGCGYGYLSRYVQGADQLHGIDADSRAVQAYADNIANAQSHWIDITDPSDAAPTNLDFIIMNPPFHMGKTTDASIGNAFVTRAANSLKSGGRLYMVANAHLPYEGRLNAHFKSVKKLHEGSGFKVYEAKA